MQRDEETALLTVLQGFFGGYFYRFTAINKVSMNQTRDVDIFVMVVLVLPPDTDRAVLEDVVRDHAPPKPTIVGTLTCIGRVFNDGFP